MVWDFIYSILLGFYLLLFGFPTDVQIKSNMAAEMGALNGFNTVDEFKVFSWSKLNTSISHCVKIQDVYIGFNLGYNCEEMIKAEYVFISDNKPIYSRGLFAHARERQLRNLTPSKYYLPSWMANDFVGMRIQYNKVSVEWRSD